MNYILYCLYIYIYRRSQLDYPVGVGVGVCVCVCVFVPRTCCCSSKPSNHAESIFPKLTKPRSTENLLNKTSQNV